MITIDEVKGGLTKLIDFLESRPTRSRFKFIILTQDGLKTIARLEKNEKACRAAMDLFLQVLKQVCKDNGLEWKTLELNQFPSEPCLVLSEKTEKRLREFQDFIKAN